MRHPHADIYQHHGPMGDEPLDLPQWRCSCCGRMFRPTVMRRMLCAGCFTDSTKHDQRHALALGEG